MYVLDVPFFLRAKDYVAQEGEEAKDRLHQVEDNAASVTNSLSFGSFDAVGTSILAV